MGRGREAVCEEVPRFGGGHLSQTGGAGRRPNRCKLFTGIGVAALCLVATVGATADGDSGPARKDFDTGPLTSKWSVELGGSLTTYDTSAAWSPAGLAGAVIILEDVLGLEEENNTYALRVTYRFSRRHAIEFLATKLERRASRAIDAEIEWGDYVFRAFGLVTTELATDIYRLKWKYDFSDSARLNTGFTAGLSTFYLGLKLEGEARLENDDGAEWVEGVVEGASGIAPVPVVGFYLDYALSQRWILRFSSDAMDLNIGGQSGRVLQTYFGFQYCFSNLFAIGIDLGGMDLRYEADEDDERYGVNYRVKSIGAHVGFSF